MSEIKNAALDPKAVARTLIITHGVAVPQSVIADAVWLAAGALLDTSAEVEALIDLVSERVQSAEITVEWEDDPGYFD